MIPRPGLAQEAGRPSRAAWITPAMLEQADTIQRAVMAAVADGIDTVIAPAPVYATPFVDGFAHLLQVADALGVQVYASIDVARVTAPDEMPSAREHVLYQHPEWLMVPRGLAAELLPIDTRSPDYLGRLRRWTRANAARVDGLYLSPLLPEAVTFAASMVAQVVRRYPSLAGVQLDAASFPGDDFDYGRRAMEAVRRDVRAGLDAAGRARMDAVEALDPFAYANEFPAEWQRLRESAMTSLLAQAAAAIKRERQQLTILAGVSGERRDTLPYWQYWLDTRIVDALSSRSGTIATITTDPWALPAEDGPAGDSR